MGARSEDITGGLKPPVHDLPGRYLLDLRKFRKMGMLSLIAFRV
jgi:hypothetical protein